MNQNTHSFNKYTVCDPLSFSFTKLRPFITQYGQQLWENTETNQCYQEFVIMTTNTVSYHQQMETYEWRRQQNEFVVRTFYVQQLDESYGFRQLRVFIEKTRTLLERLGKFNWNQGLQLFKNCLKGYQKIYRRFGLFSVTDGMISIDQKNKPKVWININFARNNYIYYQSQQNDKKDEGSMIKGVYKAVESHFQPHPFLVNLKRIVEESNSFETVFKQIQLISNNGRIPLILTKTSSQQKRKYFSKTPQNIIPKIERKQSKSPNQCLGKSHAYSRQNSFKQVSTRPSCLQFKQTSQRSKKSLGKKISLQQKLIENKLQNKQSYICHKGSQTSITPKRNEFGGYTFSSIVQKKERHYFGSNNSSCNKVQQKDQQKQIQNKSSSSREISFNSQSKRLQNGQKKITPINLLQRFTRKRTGSIFNRSPSPATAQDRFKTSQIFNPIAKSMTIIKKQLQILNNMKNKDYTKQSTSDFDYDSKSFKQSFRTKQFNESFKTALQLPNAKLVKQSFIQQRVQPLQSKVGQLRNSIFNRIDDLKQSQILVQIPQQQQISKLSVESVYKLPPKQPKLLRKMSNKPMTQSITIQSKQQRKQQISQTKTQMALDRFAKIRTQSRLHQPSNTHFSGIFVPIKQSLQEQF